MRDHNFGAALDELCSDPPASDRTVSETVELARSRLRKRRRGAIGAVVAAIAIAASGAVMVLGLGSDGRSEQPVGPADGQSVPLDLGPLTPADAAGVWGEGNFDPRFLLRRRYDSPGGPVGVIVVTAPELGQERFVLIERPGGGLRPADAPAPTAQRPIVVATRSVPVWAPDGSWATGGLFRVAATVDRVEVRVNTSNGSEPWRSAPNHNGYVFWTTWFAYADYDPSEQLTLEFRAYDTDGDPLDPALLPEPRSVSAEPIERGTTRADYIETCALLFQAAKEHLDPTGEHLSEDCSGAGMSSVHGRLTTAAPPLPWRVAGDPGVGVVHASLGLPGQTFDAFGALPCLNASDRYDSCQRREIGDGAYVWVQRDPPTAHGRAWAVTYIQPDGEPVGVTVDPLFGNQADTPVREMDITVEQAIAFVTDERLDMPTD